MDNDEKKRFSKRLNEALDLIGIPSKFEGRQKATADLIEREGGHVSQKGARKWLEGEAIPAMDNLIKLARATHTSVQWLATGSGTINNIREEPESYGYTPETIALARRINALPAPLRDMVTGNLAQAETLAKTYPGIITPSAAGADDKQTGKSQTTKSTRKTRT